MIKFLLHLNYQNNIEQQSLRQDVQSTNMDSIIRTQSLNNNNENMIESYQPIRKK